jgi:hypothetical protein
LYRLQVVTTDDVFTLSASASTPNVSLEGVVYIADGGVYRDVTGSKTESSITLYTNSSVLDFSTSHEESFQNVSVNDTVVSVATLHDKVRIEGINGVSKIKFSKGDLRIQGDGIFTLTKDSPLFGYWGKTDQLLGSADQLAYITYILSYYPTPIVRGDWMVSSITLSVPQIWFIDNEARFTLDFGELGIDKKSVELKEIDVTFKKDPLSFEKVKQKIHALIRR